MLGVHALIGCSGTASPGPLIALLIIPSTLSVRGCLIWQVLGRGFHGLGADVSVARCLFGELTSYPVALGVGMRHAAAALPAAAAALGAAALTAPLGSAVAPLNATLPAADQYDQYDDRA